MLIVIQTGYISFLINNARQDPFYFAWFQTENRIIITSFKLAALYWRKQMGSILTPAMMIW